jgi:hypothetical protein
MSGAQVAASPAWAAARAYYGAGFYWEAHELLEPVWMATAPGSAERHLVQAFIQLANARLKLRMERPKAVARLCCLSREHLVAAAVAGGPGAGFRIDQSWIAAEIAAVEGLICADEQNNA